MTEFNDLPKYHEFLAPLLAALDDMGESGTSGELNDAVVKFMRLPDEALAIEYPSGNGTVVADRISWARSYLKKAGLIETPRRTVWVMTDAGREALAWDSSKLKRYVESVEYRLRSDKQPSQSKYATQVQDELAHLDWRDSLLSVLKAMDPSAFERLAKRLLRESGFSKVEVTGQSGDGGIDGRGILQLGLMSFHVLFQCKRYQGSVGSGAVRDFRGAMMGRTDKGLLITTGTFSPDARREATRDGAPPIDLIDGEILCEKLKDLNLGVSTKLVEEVFVDAAWFDDI